MQLLNLHQYKLTPMGESMQDAANRIAEISSRTSRMSATKSIEPWLAGVPWSYSIEASFDLPGPFVKTVPAVLSLSDQGDAAAFVSCDGEAEVPALSGKVVAKALRPLDDGDGAAEEGFAPWQGFEVVRVSQAVEVKVVEVQPSIVFVDEGESGARDGDFPRDTQSAGDAARDEGLARAQLTPQGNDVSGLEMTSQQAAELEAACFTGAVYGHFFHAGPL